MHLVLTVLEIVAPVFLLAATGFAWVKAGFEYRIEFMTRLAMTLGVPCLIFTALMKSTIDSGALTTVLLAAMICYAAVTVLAVALVRATGLASRTYLAPLIFGNTGNVGLPLALFAFGETGLSYGLVVFAVTSIYSFTAGVWMVSGGGSLTRLFREPVVAATLLGALFLWQGWQTPVFLTNTLSLIGQMAFPLMLLTLGVSVARLKPRAFSKGLLLALVKYLACVAVAWVVGRWFNLPPVAFGVLVLQLSSPVAVTSYLLAGKYGTEAEAEEVAGLVVVSTLLAVATLPLTLAFVI